MGRIVIVGAGIIGLWTAFLLSEHGLGGDITIVAEHLPGDLSIDYTSPIAGAHFSCDFGSGEPRIARYCRLSYPLIKRVFAKFADELEAAGLDRMPQIEYFDKPLSADLIESYRSYTDNFVELTDPTDLAARGAGWGMRYDTFNFYSPKLLAFLQKYLESKNVTFVRSKLSSIADAPRAAHVAVPSVVFNCTGHRAPQLADFNDKTANYPVRGQVVVVRAPWIKANYSLRQPQHPPTYIIPRAHSNGRVILGGYYDAGDWTAGTSAEQTRSIIARTTALLPDLLRYGPLEVLDERAGLRPGRTGGPRIEKERIGKLTVIHNYGAGGTGYQCGLAMAQDAIDLYFGSESKL